jgi:DNA-binding NarL/FixJ family response regulator
MKTLIVEDQVLIRDLLVKFLAFDCRCEVQAEASTIAEAVQILKSTTPELILLDLGLPDGEGFEIVEFIRNCPLPRPKIIVVSGHMDSRTLIRIQKVPIDGFLDKISLRANIVKEAVDAVRCGNRFFSDSYYSSIAAIRRNPIAFDKILTRQEQVVLALIGRFLSDQDIAKVLHITVRTAETHRFSIMRKMEVVDRNHLLCFARDNGFLSGSDGECR